MRNFISIFFTNIIRVIKSRMKGGVGRVACMGKIRNGPHILMGKPVKADTISDM
jgi:hypothetical protein